MIPKGVLLGLAVGSAWEGLPLDMIYSNGPTERIVEHSRREPISSTGDTQMTIGVA
jgi:hypothetical protein